MFLIVLLQPSPERQRGAIIHAIRDIVWHAGPAISGIGRRNFAILALRGPRPHFGRSSAYAPDGITETLMLQRYACVYFIYVVWL